jgi:hypothetical protein
MVRSTQIVHLSCDEISTISKWTEMSFHYLGVLEGIQNDFYTHGMFGTNYTPILR